MSLDNMIGRPRLRYRWFAVGEMACNKGRGGRSWTGYSSGSLIVGWYLPQGRIFRSLTLGIEVQKEKIVVVGLPGGGYLKPACCPRSCLRITLPAGGPTHQVSVGELVGTSVIVLITSSHGQTSVNPFRPGQVLINIHGSQFSKLLYVESSRKYILYGIMHMFLLIDHRRNFRFPILGKTFIFNILCILLSIFYKFNNHRYEFFKFIFSIK